MIAIVLFGPPGSGKGTQSKYLINEFNLHHIPAGDILRNAIEQKTEVGLKIKSIVESGNLLPDYLISKIIENFIQNLIPKKGFIFDGYPRTLIQCLALDKVLTAKRVHLKKRIALHLNITNNEELIHRLINRSIREKRSDDTDKNVIQKRLDLYYEKTIEAVNYYKAHYLFSDLDASKPPEVIKNEIFTLIKNLHLS